MREGRGKPAPYICLVALESLNSTADSGKKPIRPNKCLVIEDSIVGVEAGRRAVMRVIWVPHPDGALEHQARQQDVLAGRMGLIEIGDDWQLAQTDDGWAESMKSIEHFDYNKYGIYVPS